MKAIGLALLGAGIALLIYGINAHNSAASTVSQTFTGHPTDKAMGLLIGGIVGIVLGSVLTLFPGKKL